jgi:hypothetical protein
MKKYILLFALYFTFDALFAQPTNTNISNSNIFDGEPYLIINSTNNQNLVTAWMGMKFTNGLFRIAIKTRASFDGGATWSAVNTLPHMGTAYGSADPSMAFDANGYLYLSYIDYKQNPDSGGIYVARSADGGLNWDAPSKAFDMYDVANKRPIDRPWLVVDKSSTANAGTLYITTKPAPWIAPPNRPYYKVSSDSGYTWTSIANLDGTGYLTGNSVAAPMAAPVTTIDGKFCAIYPSYVASQNILPCYYFASSINQGQSFNYNLMYATAPAGADTNLKSGYQLIAHPSDANKLYFVGPVSQNQDADIKALNSTDGGQTWSGPVRVNDDPLGNGKSQDMVWAAYNEQGHIATVWRDRRNDAATGFWNVGYDFYYAISDDNGQTFSVNQAMSNQFIPFDSILAENGNDFLSAAYSGDTLYTVWGDTRSGRLNIWFAKTIASTNTTVDVSILNEDNKLFQMAPNPVKEQLNITLKKEIKSTLIEIYNLQGQVVYKMNTSDSQNRIDVSHLKTGTYLIKVGNEVQRFVVE